MENDAALYQATTGRTGWATLVLTDRSWLGCWPLKEPTCGMLTEKDGVLDWVTTGEQGSRRVQSLPTSCEPKERAVVLQMGPLQGV